MILEKNEFKNISNHGVGSNLENIAGDSGVIIVPLNPEILLKLELKEE